MLIYVKCVKRLLTVNVMHMGYFELALLYLSCDHLCNIQKYILLHPRISQKTTKYTF